MQKIVLIKDGIELIEGFDVIFLYVENVGDMCCTLYCYQRNEPYECLEFEVMFFKMEDIIVFSDNRNDSVSS